MKRCFTIFCFMVLGAVSLFLFAGGNERNLSGGSYDDWYSNALKNLKEKEYNITYQDKTYLSDIKSAYQCPNRSHNFRAYFTEKETIIISRTEQKPSWEMRLSLKEANFLKSSFFTEENKIKIEKGAYRQEFINSERGLEQKIVVKEKIKNNNQHIIEIKLGGNLKPSFSIDGKSISFFTDKNISVLTLSRLSVKDKDGKELFSCYEPLNGGIGVKVDDKNAKYPLEISAILTYPSWTGETNQPNSNYGFSVASAGDVNGDGFSDVIIGANYYDNGQLDEGGAFVYYGSASGLPLSYNWHDESNFQNYQMGLAVSTAGDVNGDGFSDVIVSQNTNLNEGAVKLYYGSATGLSLTPNWIGTPNQINSWYGCSISTAGDVNGDGYSDIIVGAERYDGSLTYDEGAAFVYYGSSSGLSSTPDWLVASGQGNSYFGCSVSTAGDVNGDGYSDVIVGAKYWENPSYPDEGQAFVYYGSSSGLSTTANWTGKPNYAYSQYGCSVSTAGDVNGDGYSDIIVGAKWHTASQYREGTVFVYYGSPTGLSTANWIKSSNYEWAYFGNSVSTAGDVNGDGYSDVIVGAINYANGEMNEGAAYLFLGSSSGLSSVADWMIEGNQELAEMGCSVSSAGDVNGDGFSDILVGADKYSNSEQYEGVVFLFYGAAAGFLPSSELIKKGNQEGAEYGRCVAMAGDVNGDGFSDVLIGAPYYDNGQTDEGAAFLFYGSANGLNTTPNWFGESNQAESYFGYSLSSAGDVNGDGYSDVIIGAPSYDFKNSDDGRVFVYYGSYSGLPSSPNWSKYGYKEYTYFGVSVSTAGDVNGDGYSDTIVGAPYYENGELQEGAVYVYYGSQSGLPSQYSWMKESNQANGWYGMSVSTAGDVNGDGFSDIIIGANNYSLDQLREGAVFVHYGSQLGLSSTANWMAESNQTNSNFGFSVATAGDVNGDGFSDIAVGAKNYSNNESNEGAVFVYYGSSAGLPSNYNWLAESNITGIRFGHSVSSAGDVNGDGYSDLLVGAPFYSNTELQEGAAYLYLGSSSGLASSYSWLNESNSENALFGYSVCGAGDINADGYSDVVIGALDYSDDISYQGAFFVSYGNEKRAKTINYLQLRPLDSALIVPPLLTLSNDSFMLKFFGNTEFGRAIGKAQIEAKKMGEQFNGAQLYEGEWIDLMTTGNNFSELKNGLQKNALYKWRARIKYQPKYGMPIHSRWFYLQSNALNEADFRTGFGPPPDSDGDGYNDEIDCNPYDNSVWAVPSEAINFFVSKDPTDNLVWSAPLEPGCLTPVYDVLRSESASDFSSALCIASNITSLSATDNDQPSNVFYYLVRSENQCGSNLGKNSQGVDRTGRNCP